MKEDIKTGDKIIITEIGPKDAYFDKLHWFHDKVLTVTNMVEKNYDGSIVCEVDESDGRGRFFINIWAKKLDDLSL